MARQTAAQKREAKAREDAWKAEQARIEREAPAHLTWTDPVAPDVPPPACYGHTEGWDFRVSLGSWGDPVTVERAWSTAVSHGTGVYSARASGSQGSRALYSTEALALRAARHEVCRRAARMLLSVDERIAKVSQ